MMEEITFNAKTKIWSDKKFYPQYVCSWRPQTLPTLLIGSINDMLLPFTHFLNDHEWRRSNIQILKLENPGHFPWVTDFNTIRDSFCSFEQKL